MRKEKKGKKVRIMPFGIGLLIFLVALGAGIASKFVQPAWAKEYSVTFRCWSSEAASTMS